MTTLTEQLHDLAALIEATAERDASFQRKANALASKIEKFLRSKKMPEQMFYNSGAPWTGGEPCLHIGMWEIDPKYRDMDLSLYYKSANPSAAGTMGPSRQVQGRFHLRLFILPDDLDMKDYVGEYIDQYNELGEIRPTQAYIGNRAKMPIPGYVHNLIVHELIHYFDFHRGGQGFTKAVRSGALLSAGKRTEYFNTPEEFNAYYQAGANQVASETRKLVGKLKRGDKKAQGIATVFIDHSSFTNWVAMGGFWHAPWIESLNTEYRRKFKSRLFQLFEALRKQVEQAYNQGFKEKFDQVMGHMGAYERKVYGQTTIHREWPVPGNQARVGKFTRVQVPDPRLFIPGKRT